jgi:Na+/H+ antiporter NhaD/arsenite permease-like protein
LEIFEFFLATILLVTLALLVFEKGDKIMVSLTGAGLALFLAILPLWGVTGDQIIIDHVEDLLLLIEPDLMFIIVGMTLLVRVCFETGIFERNSGKNI